MFLIFPLLLLPLISFFIPVSTSADLLCASIHHLCCSPSLSFSLSLSISLVPVV